MLLSAGTPVAWNADGLADFHPVRANQTYYASSGLSLTGMFAAYAELYKVQPWVYTLVTKLGRSTSRIPVKNYRRLADGSRVDDRESPYADLLRRPSPRMGAKRLWLWTAATRELYGEAIWIKLRDDKGRVREVHPIHPTNIIVRRADVDREIIGFDGKRRQVSAGDTVYIYAPGSRVANVVVEFTSEDVVHFSNYNPETLMRGLSPCEPLRQTLLSEDAARRGQAALWRNGARPSVALSTDQTMTQGAIDRLSAQWDGAHAGIDSWGKTAILEQGLKPVAMQITPDDMQYIAGRQLNRDECCAVWDVPPPAVHILDRATFSNITEQMRSLYRDTMAPRFNDYEDTLATQLAPDFDPSGDSYAEFLIDEVLRGAYEVRVPANAQAIQTGQSTINEIRRQENKPDIEGGDELFLNSALLPLTTLLRAGERWPGPEGPPAPVPAEGEQPAGDDADTTGKALTERDGRTLAGRLSRVTDLRSIDLAALTRGLDGDPSHVAAVIQTSLALGEDVKALRRRLAGQIALNPLQEDS